MSRALGIGAELRLMALRLSGLRVLSRVPGIDAELRLMRCAYQAYGV